MIVLTRQLKQHYDDLVAQGERIEQTKDTMRGWYVKSTADLANAGRMTDRLAPM